MNLLTTFTSMLKGILIVIALLTYLAFPTAVSATDFVMCEGLDCNACHLIEMVNLIVEWVFFTAAVLAFAIMAFAGFKLITSAGDASGFEQAKRHLWNVIIGFVVLMGAWVAVDTVIKLIATDEVSEQAWGMWNDVECPGLVSQSTDLTQIVIEDETGIPGAAPGEVGGGGGAAGPGVTPTGNLTEYQGRLFDESVVGNVQGLQQAVPGLRLSGGHRTPERNAEVNGSPTSHHLTGRAADFVGSSADMQAGADWARANGAREVIIHNAGSGTHLHVAW